MLTRVDDLYIFAIKSINNQLYLKFTPYHIKGPCASLSEFVDSIQAQLKSDTDVEVALDRQINDGITFNTLLRLENNSLARLIECVVKISHIQGLTRARFQSELLGFKPVPGCSIVDGRLTFNMDGIKGTHTTLCVRSGQTVPDAILYRLSDKTIKLTIDDSIIHYVPKCEINTILECM